MAELTAKAIKKAIKRRFDYMREHRNDLTLRDTRRLLETDLQLPPNALDEEPHKSLIKHQVDEIMRLLVRLETESDGGAAAQHAPNAAHAKRAREEPAKSRAEEPPKLGSSARALALKAVLKRATIPIAPALYKATAGDEDLFCTALEQALAHEGLHHGSTEKEIIAVRQRRERARDLDGIDASNVVREGEVRLRRAAVAAVAPAAAHAMAYGGAGAAVDEARDAALSPPGRRRKLRVDEWDDDDE